MGHGGKLNLKNHKQLPKSKYSTEVIVVEKDSKAQKYTLEANYVEQLKMLQVEPG